MAFRVPYRLGSQRAGIPEIKILFIALWGALLSASATTVLPPAEVSLGSPRHEVEPPSSVIAGYATVVYPVRIKNTSKQPIWFYGQLRKLPYYRLFIRPAESAQWADRTLWMCGMGAEFHELAPGASTSFTVFVPAGEVGHQIRVEVPIYESPNTQTKPIRVTSEAIPIR